MKYFPLFWQAKLTEVKLRYIWPRSETKFRLGCDLFQRRRRHFILLTKQSLLRLSFCRFFLIFHCRYCADRTEKNLGRDLNFSGRHRRSSTRVTTLSLCSLTSIAICAVVVGIRKTTFAGFRHFRSLHIPLNFLKQKKKTLT